MVVLDKMGFCWLKMTSLRWFTAEAVMMEDWEDVAVEIDTKVDVGRPMYGDSLDFEVLLELLTFTAVLLVGLWKTLNPIEEEEDCFRCSKEVQ